MTKAFTCILLIGLLSGCKKTVEKIKEDKIVSAMTDGQWVVTSFIHNSNDVTTEFSAYTFQYFSNRTVDAIKNGTVEISGNWDGNVSAMTTWANFSNANAPIPLLNGLWHIDNNNWTFAVLSQSNGMESKHMRLDKL